MKEELTKEQDKAYHDYLVKHIDAVNICYRLLTGNSLEDHDHSKCSEDEYYYYAKYFYTKGGRPKTSHTEKETNEFNYAWLNHIHHNPHHWQYWILINDDDGTVALEMTYRYLMEMIADWGSFSLMSKNPNGIILFWEDHRDKYIFHPETRKKVERLVPVMAEKIAKYLRSVIE